MFKKKQYQPTRPSPLVLYSSTTSDDDQSSLKIKLRVERGNSPKTPPKVPENTEDSNKEELIDYILSPKKLNYNKDTVRLKDHTSSINGRVSTDDLEQDECLTDDNENDGCSNSNATTSRKRTYTSSSANSDSEETIYQQRKSHKRGRQKKDKLSIKKEFSDLEGLDDIKYGIYMLQPDETNLLDPKNHPEIIKMLSLIWAKCKGYPSYPALTIDPKMPSSGYQINGVPIPIPNKEILEMNDDEQKYLILFFDARRTWQWLPREKIEPLGVDSRLDEVKLIESRKPSMRKNVQEAYKRAITFRHRIEIGENDDDDEVVREEKEVEMVQGELEEEVDDELEEEVEEEIEDDLEEEEEEPDELESKEVLLEESLEKEQMDEQKHTEEKLELVEQKEEVVEEEQRETQNNFQ